MNDKRSRPIAGDSFKIVQTGVVQKDWNIHSAESNVTENRKVADTLKKFMSGFEHGSQIVWL